MSINVTPCLLVLNVVVSRPTSMYSSNAMFDFGNISALNVWSISSSDCSLRGCEAKFCSMLKDRNISNLLSQTSQKATSSLELQLHTARKVLELTRNVGTLSTAATEASKLSTQIVEILALVSTYRDTASTIDSISDNVRMLALESQGRHSRLLGSRLSNSMLYSQRQRNCTFSNGFRPANVLTSIVPFAQGGCQALANGCLIVGDSEAGWEVQVQSSGALVVQVLESPY